MKESNIAALKAVYRIPDAWRDLGYAEQPAKTCCSPFREDKHPSFSVFNEGMRWRDFATNEAGDVLDFICRARGGDTVAAIRFIEARKGNIQKPAIERSSPKWPELRSGTRREWTQLNTLRGFGIEAMQEAGRRGFLHFGGQWGCDFWSVTDSRRRLIELRRSTGELWRAYGRMPERKAHCIGNGKDWPIGIVESKQFPKIALCEGAPDMIAAIHFAQVEGKAESVAPVAMLGAGMGRIASDALLFFRGKEVRIYQHLDEAGRKAVRVWAEQITEAGAAHVDAFDFTRLMRDDGKPGKDLADVCRIAPDCWEQERKFGEMMP